MKLVCGKNVVLDAGFGQERQTMEKKQVVLSPTLTNQAVGMRKGSVLVRRVAPKGSYAV